MTACSAGDSGGPSPCSGSAPDVPPLEVRDLTVTYRAGRDLVRAVRGVSFSLGPGQVLGIAGESGSGKTTVGLGLLRLLPPTASVSGRVLLHGEDLLGAGWGRLRAVRWAGASVVFQGAMSALNPVQTIGKQIREPIILHEKVSARVAGARAADLLDSVGVPARRQGSYPHELSGGQRQRVMIAMALACRPDLIIADEPTTALDVIVRAQVLALLADLVREQRISVIMISHDLSVLAGTCDRLAVMYAGRLVEAGPSAELIDDPGHPYTRILARAFPRIGDPGSRQTPAGLPGDPPDLRADLAGCPFAPRCPETMPACTSSDIELRPAGPARESACIKVLVRTAPAAASAAGSASAHGPAPASQRSPVLAPALPPAPAPAPDAAGMPDGWAAPALAARGLRVVFPARHGRGPARAVDDVNLSVAPGEILALIGESGCGKSTLARALVGLLRPAGGEVLRGGTPLQYSPHALKRHRRVVQLILQDPGGSLNPRQSVFDAVAEGPRLHGMRGHLGDRVHSALARAGLRPPAQFAARYPHELSGGQQQRVVIAGALALEPSVLVADEPVSSLDCSVRGGILRLLLDLRDQLSLSAIIVSHDLGVAWNAADRVAVMYLGRIVETGPVTDVLLRPRHPYTQALISVLPGGTNSGGPVILGGEPPDPTAIPAGCRFHPRCPRLAALEPADPRTGACRTRTVPVLPSAGPHENLAACHLADGGSTDGPARSLSGRSQAG